MYKVPQIGDLISISDLEDGDLVCFKSDTWPWMVKLQHVICICRYGYKYCDDFDKKVIFRDIEGLLTPFTAPKFLLRKGFQSFQQVEDFIQKSGFPTFENRIELVLCDKLGLLFSSSEEEIIKRIRAL